MKEIEVLDLKKKYVSIYVYSTFKYNYDCG